MITENRRKYTAIFEKYETLYKPLEQGVKFIHTLLRKEAISGKEVIMIHEKIVHEKAVAAKFYDCSIETLILTKKNLSYKDKEQIKAQLENIISSIEEPMNVEIIDNTHPYQTVAGIFTNVQDEEKNLVASRTSILLSESLALREMFGKSRPDPTISAIPAIPGKQPAIPGRLGEFVIFTAIPYENREKGIYEFKDVIFEFNNNKE